MLTTIYQSIYLNFTVTENEVCLLKICLQINPALVVVLAFGEASRFQHLSLNLNKLGLL